jgi:hypothetical protein
MTWSSSLTGCPTLAAVVLMASILSGCAATPTTRTSSNHDVAANPDGVWHVVISIKYCGEATLEGDFNVTGGRYNATIGDYRWSDGPDLERVSIAGTVYRNYDSDFLHVEGDETLRGDACDGSEGYGGFFDPSQGYESSGSAWGLLNFTRALPKA